MTIDNLQEAFFGKPIEEFRSGGRASGRDVVYRLVQDYDDKASQESMLAELFGQVDPASIVALVIGAWSNPQENSPQGYLDSLAANRARLRALRALFVGDMTFEECEMSWIIQGDYKGVLQAFPQVEVLRIRGTESLKLEPFRHEHLIELAIESGGLPNAIVANVAKSTMPALKHLELWLGDDGYGFNGSVGDYEKLLIAVGPQRLSYLGLRNSMIADELATWLAGQAWVGGLDTLDLSFGTLGDAGAKALFASPHVAKLKRLDLTHHYIGEEWQRKLKTLPMKVELDEASDEDEGDRFVKVSE